MQFLVERLSLQENDDRHYIHETEHAIIIMQINLDISVRTKKIEF